MPAATHCSLNVGDLDASVAFYRALTGGEPARRERDYAKFELADPPLVLALVEAPRSGQNPINHVGLRVPDRAALDTIRARLERLGLAGELEQQVECCYSTQTKFWSADPDGTWWEVYVHEGDAATLGRTEPVSPPPTAAHDVRTWTHRLADGWPDAIPHADGSLDEVLLEGSINLKPASGLPALLRDAHRALKPHGSVTLHGLVASQPVVAGALHLPGPAAAVQRVPVESEPTALLAAAGFDGIRIDRIAPRAHFSAGGAEMREIVVTARRPPASVESTAHAVVYRGPLASVVDDHGTVYRRGERTYVPRRQLLALLDGPCAGDFAELIAAEGHVLEARDGCCP
jgi:catechol 2,3-dioxygenase-like lactoylglutathione lyase family enzyme